MGKKGFTILELIISIAIFAVVLGIVYFTYTNLLKGSAIETGKAETQLEKIVGMELLRLDLTHVGYGIAKDETSPIIEWDIGNKILTLRATLNNTRQETLGWILVDCSAGCEIVSNSLPLTNRTYYIFFTDVTSRNSVDSGTLNVDDAGIVTNIEIGNRINIIPNSYRLLGFPITQEVYTGTANSCDAGYCNMVKYDKTFSNLPNRCNPNTYKLIRRTGLDAINNLGGDTVIACVADHLVTFDIDSNGDGEIDMRGYSLPAVDTDGNGVIDNYEIRKQLKRMNFYILYQEGVRDLKFKFTNTVSCGGNQCIGGIDADLVLPPDYINYRWKAIKISVKPMDL